MFKENKKKRIKIGEHLKFLILENTKDSITFMMANLKEMRLKSIKIAQKEKEFERLILEAYQASTIDGFATIHGKKGGDFVSLGPINQPLSRNHVEEVISECLKNNITSVDILGFEYEMGLFPTIQEEAKSKGLRLSYKQIPMEVFDKRAVSKGEIVFHDVAYIEFKPHFNGENFQLN